MVTDRRGLLRLMKVWCKYHIFCCQQEVEKIAFNVVAIIAILFQYFVSRQLKFENLVQTLQERCNLDLAYYN